MKRWKQKLIASGIMVAIGVVFIFHFGFITAGSVWLAAAVLLAWMH
jgi:hypothetical protein